MVVSRNILNLFYIRILFTSTLLINGTDGKVELNSVQLNPTVMGSHLDILLKSHVDFQPICLEETYYGNSTKFISHEVLAHVACRQLGLMTFKNIFPLPSSLVPKVVPLSIKTVCLGNEQSLDQCEWVDATFNMNCTTIMGLNCGDCFKRLTIPRGSSVFLSSPGYPYYYLYLLTCQWSINSPTNTSMVVEITHWKFPGLSNLGDTKDGLVCDQSLAHLEIRDGGVVAMNVCGFAKIKSAITTSSNIVVRFQSGYLIPQKHSEDLGFLLKIHATPTSFGYEFSYAVKTLFIVGGVLLLIIIGILWHYGKVLYARRQTRYRLRRRRGSCSSIETTAITTVYSSIRSPALYSRAQSDEYNDYSYLIPNSLDRRAGGSPHFSTVVRSGQLPSKTISLSYSEDSVPSNSPPIIPTQNGTQISRSSLPIISLETKLNFDEESILYTPMDRKYASQPCDIDKCCASDEMNAIRNSSMLNVRVDSHTRRDTNRLSIKVSHYETPKVKGFFGDRSKGVQRFGGYEKPIVNKFGNSLNSSPPKPPTFHHLPYPNIPVTPSLAKSLPNIYASSSVRQNEVILRPSLANSVLVLPFEYPDDLCGDFADSADSSASSAVSMDRDKTHLFEKSDGDDKMPNESYGSARKGKRRFPWSKARPPTVHRCKRKPEPSVSHSPLMSQEVRFNINNVPE